MSGQGTLPTGGGYAGPAWLRTRGSFNVLDFLMRQIIAGKAFSAFVEVKGVSGGGLSGPATVAVRPMVGQVDGFGNVVPHGTIYSIPCFRYQAGNCAVIVDPIVGDTGLAVICDRDISIVKATGAVSPPGSFRQHDWADGCYFGEFLGGTPANYLWITPTGLALVTPGTLTIQAANATLDASGNLSVAGEVTGKSGGAGSVTLTGHKHAQGNDSAGDTEADTAAPTGGT